MEFELVSPVSTPTETLRYQLESRLAEVLTWNRREIESVHVTVGSLPRPKGGADKYCRIAVRLVGAPGIVIEHISRDLNTAVRKSADRAQQVVLDMLSARRRKRRRRGLGVLW